PRGLEGIDADVLPPQILAARAMERAVMTAAERDGELIAHPAAKRLFLGKADVVRIDRALAAHEAGLTGDQRAVSLFRDPARRTDGEFVCVDAARLEGRFGVGRSEPIRQGTAITRGFRRGFAGEVRRLAVLTFAIERRARG